MGSSRRLHAQCGLRYVARLIAERQYRTRNRLSVHLLPNGEIVAEPLHKLPKLIDQNRSRIGVYSQRWITPQEILADLIAGIRDGLWVVR